MDDMKDNHRKKVSIGGELVKDEGIIRLKKVILVEGQDEVYFFDALLRHLNVTDIEVHEIGGKAQFKDTFPTFCRSRGFKDVEYLAVIRDADDDANGQFNSITHVLREVKMDVPSISTT